MSKPEMVELWLRICKGGRSRKVKELVDYYGFVPRKVI